MTLQELRIKKNLSQSQLAAIIGISKKTIQGYEQGTKNINKASGETIYLLSKALGVTMEEVLEKERIDR